MLVSLDIKNNQIANFQVVKREEFDKLTVPIAKVQYILRFYMLYLFEMCMKSNNEENLSLLKGCAQLIRKYSQLHKDFMSARTDATNEELEIFEDILKNHPEQILEEEIWR
jgi:hypothetical protein